MAASSNTRSGGNNKDIQKAKDKAEIKKIINPNNTKNAIGNQIKGAVLTGPLIGAAVGKAAGYVGAKAGGKVVDAAFKASTKGFGASGAGGKIKDVLTPFGKTISATRIGTDAQQAARMGNLETAKIKEAVSAGADIGMQVIRGINMAGKIVKAPAAIVISGKVTAPKKKKK